jgi:murein L,D-transpeptidase YafK
LCLFVSTIYCFDRKRGIFYEVRMGDSVYSVNDFDQLHHPRLVVSKAARTLEVYEGDVLLARMHAALGREASGPKAREGDQRTPEGVYAVCVKNAESKYYLSLGLNYPNAADAQRGLAEGIITHAQHDAIVVAIQSGQRPPWDTPLGGEIMIHGGGACRDWTAGCVALDDECMDYLWEITEIGTEVEIRT